MTTGWRRNLCLLLVFLLPNVLAISTEEVFNEELSLRPLRDGKLAARFSFTTLLKGARPRNPKSLSDNDTPQHYTLFPLALGQILREYAVTELHLTLNAGKWDYDRWGYPEESGIATGAELWAWMGDSPSTTVDSRWQGLRNALAGLFCASLGSLNEQRTTSPNLAFPPEGTLPSSAAPYHLLHASLPSEHVCTENLTPFLKLLPCKSSSGIASLLNPHRLFDADWHGLGIHVRYLQGAGVELRLTFQGVFDPVRYSHDNRRDWSLRSVFDRTIDRACPVAYSSKIRVELPTEQSYTISPDPSVINSEVATYTITEDSVPLDVAMRWPEETAFQYPLSPPIVPMTHLSIQRTLKGSSQSDAQLFVTVTNNSPIEIRTTYLETMPWLLQFYLHTLRAEIDGRSRDDLVSVVSYTAPVLHSRPSLLQAVLTLPPQNTLRLKMAVSKSFLRYTEHPPDAQRGWDLPSAIFVPLFQNSSSRYSSAGSDTAFLQDMLPRRIYTPALLVDPATPDFSMPYNVIIMSCTLIALIFGSIFNLLTRKFVVVRVEGDDDAVKQRAP